MQSFYYLKPGQTLRNTKISERSLGLMMDKETYNYFQAHTTAQARAAALARKEAKRIEDLKKNSHEMSKNWDNTIQNIQKRRREELLSKRKRDEEARIAFFKELTLQKLAERAEIVKQARKLLLHQKTNCLEFSKARLASECYKIRDLQLEEKKRFKEEEKELKEKWDKFILEDSRKFHEEKQQTLSNIAEKERKYKEEIKQQIEFNEEYRNRKNMEEKNAEIEDLKNMAKELKLLKENEIQEEIQKRAVINDLFKTAIEEKKRQKLRKEQDDEYQKQIFEAYLRMKQRILKQMKASRLKAQNEKHRRAELIGKKFGAQMTSKAAEEEEYLKKLKEEKEAAQLERLKADKEHKEKVRLQTEKGMQAIEKERKEMRRQEKTLNDWETMQRFKRDEFDKQWKAKHAEDERRKRQEYAATLKEQMEENKMKQRKEEQEKTDFENATLKMMQNTNERVLEYGNQVLQEVEGVSPTYPIIKAIERFKKKSGLLPKHEPEVIVPKVTRKIRGRRRYCTKPVPEDKIFCFS